MSHTIALIIASVLIIPGIAMALIPMLPALSYMFVIALAFAIYDGFDILTRGEILILLGIVFVSIAVDHISGLLGAKYGGAHTKSLLWGMLGGFIGTFFLPPLGTFIGLFLAILIAEIYYKKTREEAVKAAKGALIGTAVGIGVNVLLAILFTGSFIYFGLS